MYKFIILFLIFLFNLQAIELSNDEVNFIKTHKTINVANEIDWIPYDYFENNQPKGYVVDYTKLIFRKIGIEPIFITDTWQNLLKKYSNKQIDVFPVLGLSDERIKLFDFTKSYINQELSIVTKNTRFDIINIDDLSGQKIAMVKNWNLTKVIKNNYPKIDVIEYDTLEKVFDSIKDNYTDATIQNELISNYNIDKTYYDSLKISSKITVKDFDEKLYMGVSKDLKPLTSILNKVISEITIDEVKSLKAKWFNLEKKINFTQKELEFIEKKTIKIAFMDKWAPINFVENNKAYGLGYDFWKYIADKANIKAKLIIKENFSDALTEIKEKTSDIIIATSRTSDREKYAIFTDTFYKVPIGIATLQDKNFIPNPSALIGKKVGVGKNYTSYKLLSKQYPQINFIFFNNIKEGLELLSNNSVYAVVDNMSVLVHNLEKYAYSNIKISGTTGIDFNLQMMIRDDYDILQSIINKVLSTMNPNDKKNIYNKWSNLEYEKAFDYTVLWKYFLPLILIILLILYKNRQLVLYQRELKDTKGELENTLKTFRSLVNLTIEGIVILNKNEIIYYNDEILKIFDIDSKKLINTSFNDFFVLNDNYTFEDMIKNSNSETLEILGLKKLQTKFPILIKSKNVIFENKQSTILSIIDMSEIKDKENLLIQQSKMASLGEMIGNIAHQWRQPLSLISTAASGIKIQKEFDQLDDKFFYETIDNITNTTKFLSQTIDDFQNYLKDDKIKKYFDINDSIKKILNIIKTSFINHSINVILDLENDLSINSYENELNQVFLNIFNNSKDALLNIHNENRYLYIKSYKKNQKIIIEIIDNAGGIDESIIDKIFEPYFTTKHKSQGTGLGLYMTHNIVTSSMNGEIEVINTNHIFENKVFNNCTKVKIILPIS